MREGKHKHALFLARIIIIVLVYRTYRYSPP
jgi:hypothetical protein